MNTRRPEDVSSRGFIVAAALLFLGSTAVTLAWCGSMAEMPGMPMPGGWTMSMAWMRMSGQSWAAASASFLGMWTVMMIAMMLPAFLPTMSRHRQAAAASGAQKLGPLTWWMSLGYFFTWMLSGVLAFPLGVLVASLEMQQPALARAVPALAGLVLLAAGALQVSAWKARQLACCRSSGQRDPLPPGARAAWQQGLRDGIACIRCCAPLTAVLFVLGVMDLWAMALVTLAISAERIAPRGLRAARASGAMLLAAGCCLFVRAIQSA